MNDWGTVWDTADAADLSQSKTKLSSLLPLTPQADTFDDFEDFGDAVEPNSAADFGDDFGDFGKEENIVGFEDVGGFNSVEPSRLPSSWEPLRLDPLPDPADLASSVQELLDAVWPLPDPESVMTSEDIRQVEGLNQILITPESRDLYQMLFNATPDTLSHAPNWIRSRIRRQHLISLGIPINLDEVMPQTNTKPMPMLSVTTRPSSAPPGPRQSLHLPSPPSENHARTGSRPGTPQLSGKSAQVSPHGLGSKPKLNEEKITEMLDMTQDTLSLLPLSTLQNHLKTLQTLKNDTAGMLTYLLQVRDALQQDSETYNGLIAELVSEAQKLKSGPSRLKNGGKRGSGV